MNDKLLILRNRAEEVLKLKGKSMSDDFVTDIEKLLEELNIYQIELEMQNQELQETNLKLQVEQKRYKELYMNAPVAYFTLNSTGNIIELNQAAAELLQIPIQRFKYTSIFPYISEHSKPDFVKQFKLFFESQKIEYGKIIFHTPNKELLYTKLSAICYFDTDLNELLVRCSVVDITENENYKAEIELALKESEELHREVLSNISDAVFITDENDNFTFICPNVENIFGYTKSEISDFKKIAQLFDEEFIKNQKLNFISEKQNIEKAIYDKTGNEHYLIVNIKKVNIGNGTILYTCRDITERRLAKLQSTESEAKFQSIFNNAKNPIFLLNKEGKYIAINQAYKDLTGYEISDFSDRIAGFRANSEDLPEIQRILKKLLNSEIQNYNKEVRIITKSGVEKWISLFVSVHNTQNGDFDYILGSFFDITKQKNDEKEIKDIAEKYKQLFEFMPAGISVADINGNLIQSNKAAERILSVPREIHNSSTIDNKQWKIIRRDGSVMPVTEYAGVIALKENRLVENIEMGIVKSDNLITWISVNAIPTIKNDRVIISYTDISDKFEKEKKLIDYSEELTKLSIAIEQSPITVVITDTNANIQYVNPKFTELTGYTLQEALGKNPRVLKSGKTESKIFTELWETITSGNIWKGELINKKKNGEIFIESAQIAPIKDNDGKIINYVAIKEDITERKKQEEIIFKSNIKLKELNATKDKFFGIIAHDLRNPFSAILGFSELLIKHIEKYDKEKILSFAKSINNATQNTYKLLENLLEWARIQRGIMTFNLENIKLNGLLKELVPVLQEIANQKKIILNYSCNDDVILRADRNMITTILRNLITNSIKFTNHSGNIEIIAQNVDNDIIISVTDNGIGMDDETRNNLFKFDSTQTRRGTDNETGTGLGLILCKEFIEKHKGTLTVESEIDKGSKFTIVLPKI